MGGEKIGKGRRKGRRKGKRGGGQGKWEKVRTGEKRKGKKQLSKKREKWRVKESE